MMAPKITVHRTPILSATTPMAMPPAPSPTQANELASAGTERRPPVSAAISLRATMTIHGAPNETVRMTSATVATVQDSFDSIDCTISL